jgi:hypothetical protein
VDTCLIVFAGEHDWNNLIEGTVQKMRLEILEAHHVLFLEHGLNSRFALLLVHWTESECDAIVNVLEQFWEFGFVNGVMDLNRK